MMNGVMQTKAGGNREEIARALRILGVIILVIGLLVPLWQARALYLGEQSDLLGDLCWIVVGMAIEFFGVGLIILSDKRQVL